MESNLFLFVETSAIEGHFPFTIILKSVCFPRGYLKGCLFGTNIKLFYVHYIKASILDFIMILKKPLNTLFTFLCTNIYPLKFTIKLL